MPLGLLGKKLGQTRVYDAQGVIHSVTIVDVGPNRVIQVKTQGGKDGYNSVQLGFEEQKEQRVAKPTLGHFKKFGTPAYKRVKEFRNFSKEVKSGDTVGADLFAVGDYIDAIGVASKVWSHAMVSGAATARTVRRDGIAVPAPSASVCFPAPSCAG